MKGLVVFLICILPWLAQAEYSITGKVNISEGWQQQLFLATIDRLDNYYKVDPSNIINVATIASDGSFSLSGDNLPDQSQYYRLFLIKEENSEFDVCLYVGGDDHNYVHIILDNNSQLDLTADPTYVSPFGNYTVVGSSDNILMRELNRLVLPSYYFFQIKFPSELQFSQDKLNRDLITFADTCSSTMIGLAALNNVDMDNYYALHESVFARYRHTMETQYRNHPYTQDLRRKLDYYAEEPPSNKTSYIWILTLLLGIASLTLFFKNRILQKQVNQLSERIDTKAPKKIHLTNQEQKILQLIVEGKSNKEIAGDLFVELSTVKTHINKLYGKINAKDRNHAITIGRNLLSIGV